MYSNGVFKINLEECKTATRLFWNKEKKRKEATMQERLIIHLGNSKELICLAPEQILYV